nr:hypothetical protein [Streptomyces sp. ME01-18a]
MPHQARHSLATSLLRAGASLTHIRRYLGQRASRNRVRGWGFRTGVLFG